MPAWVDGFSGRAQQQRQYERRQQHRLWHGVGWGGDLGLPALTTITHVYALNRASSARWLELGGDTATPHW